MAALSYYYNLRETLGLGIFFADHVPSYSSFTAPLMVKLKEVREKEEMGSMVKVKLNEEGERVVDLMLNLNGLQPDTSVQFVLYTDASGFALGAFLR